MTWLDFKKELAFNVAAPDWKALLDDLEFNTDSMLKIEENDTKWTNKGPKACAMSMLAQEMRKTSEEKREEFRATHMNRAAAAASSDLEELDIEDMHVIVQFHDKLATDRAYAEAYGLDTEEKYAEFMKFYKYTENIGEALGVAEQISEINLANAVDNRFEEAKQAGKSCTDKTIETTKEFLNNAVNKSQIDGRVDDIAARANNRFIVEFMREFGLFRMRVGLYYPGFKTVQVDGKDTKVEVEDYYSDLMKKLEEKKNVPAETREIKVREVPYQIAKDEQLPDDFTGGLLNGTITAEAFGAKVQEFNDACMKAATYANASSPDFIGDDVELKDFKKDTGILAYDVKTSRRFYEAEKVRLAKEIKGMVH